MLGRARSWPKLHSHYPRNVIDLMVHPSVAGRLKERQRLKTSRALVRRRQVPLVIGVLLLLLLSVGGCSVLTRLGITPAGKNAEETTNQDSHSLSEDQVDAIVKDVRKDVELLEELRTDASLLEAGLAGSALEEFIKTLNADLSNGKIKVRNFQDVRIELKNYTGGVAGLSLEYRDRSFYMASESRQPLTTPTNANKQYTLAAKKIDGRWKITDFLGPPHDPRPPESEERQDSAD